MATNVFDRARAMVSALCDGKRDWVMSIPADPVRDPDLVIAEAIGAGEALYTALEDLLAKLVVDDEEGLIEYAEPIIKARAALAKARGEEAPHA